LGGEELEPADPVNFESYAAPDGARLSDFVYPQWFIRGSAGPWDQVHTPGIRPHKLGYGEQP
jgi:hypothetical protein